MDTTFQSMMKKLNSAKPADKVETLQTIASLFNDNTSPLLRDAVIASNLIKEIAEVLKATKQWATAHPDWLQRLTGRIFHSMELEIPQAQVKSLVQVLANHLSTSESLHTVNLLGYIARTTVGRSVLLDFPNVYSIQHRAFIQILFKQIDTIQQLCLQTQNSSIQVSAQRLVQRLIFNETWQQKIIEDTQFILKLLEHPSENMWIIILNLSDHPENKKLLPSEVLKAASSVDSEDCFEICAKLCNEADAVSLKLNVTFVEDRANHLEALLEKQHQLGYYQYDLLSVTLPFVNLSIADANKEALGKRLIPLLMRVLAIERDKPLIQTIDRCLKRGKQESAKALWNLAFLDSNRKRISDNGGFDFLKRILATTSDDILKRNVEGILYMLKEPTPIVSKSSQTSGGHIMISYNWDNQPTTVRLAQSLKERGYTVWLDIEKMKGSTLEAMAHAIEGSEVVLMCMTQKYKDSPNCRLEGEYCINRKIDFIPLMLQNEYKPDGWLGIALGTKLYYNFASESGWESKIDSLVNAIGNRGKQHEATLSPTFKPQDSQQQTKSIAAWTDEELLAWLKSEEIGQHYDLFIKHKLNGKRILALKGLKSTAMLIAVKEYLQITCLGDAMDIITAVKKIEQ